MLCKNCGSQIPDDAKFCAKCGTPVNVEDLNISAAGVERTVPRGFSAKKNIIIIIIAAVLLIGGGITAIAMVSSHSASSGVSDKLQLAERYLNEQNYEQAIIEFQKVLEIEPMNVDTYLGLADAYLCLGQKDKAIEILEEGLEKTGDDRIKSKLDELTKKPEISSSVSSAASSKTPVSSAVSSTTPVSSSTSSSSTTTSSSTFSSSSAVSSTTTSSSSVVSSITTSSSTTPPPAPQPLGTVTILGKEYDIATTTELNLTKRYITNEQLREIIPEVEKLTNLTDLYLGRNKISDITPLANLTNLTYLRLNDNQISDITPLTKLTNLTYLELSDNRQIKDITPLSKLTNLTDLYLVNDWLIDDITPLANLTNLTFLNLYNLYLSSEDLEWLKTQLPDGCYIHTEANYGL